MGIVLVLNAGSSSQKSCLYSLGESLTDTLPKPLWEAHLDWTSEPERGILLVTRNRIQEQIYLEKGDNALQVILDTLVVGKTKVLNSLNDIDVVGHRIVHGGAKYNRPTLITPEVKKAIADLIPLAPNHNRAHLEGINAISSILPQVPQVAVFDTSFHTTIPQTAKVYPLPYEWYEQGIQRYGFHGISHEYCAHRSAQILQQPLAALKIVTCHLGNGCSLAAIQDGICIDTTMGFSPLEGLMMGTRCGSIDPQIPIYMMQEYGLSFKEVNEIFNKKSGLQGISGKSGDMRTIAKESGLGDKRSRLALDMYIYRLKSAIGAMVATLNGLDVLVFTAGIGENSSIVRERTCEGLSYLGLQLDLKKNNASPIDENIASDNSQIKVLVIHTREDLAIARYASFLIFA
jgi:acetate kinase